MLLGARKDDDAEKAMEKEGSDTESAEASAAEAAAEADANKNTKRNDGQDSVVAENEHENQENNSNNKNNNKLGSRVNSILASIKKTVSPAKKNKDATDSEAKSGEGPPPVHHRSSRVSPYVISQDKDRIDRADNIELQEGDANDKKEDDDDVTYADLDKTALKGDNSNNGSTAKQDEATEYSEIQPKKN